MKNISKEIRICDDEYIQKLFVKILSANLTAMIITGVSAFALFKGTPFAYALFLGSILIYLEVSILMRWDKTIGGDK